MFDDGRDADGLLLILERRQHLDQPAHEGLAEHQQVE